MLPGHDRTRVWLASRWRDPVAWTEAIQLVKTAVAAALAWLLAVRVFHLPQPFLAPWTALLVVHATVYRTFSRGVQQVSATVIGILLAWSAGNLFGLNPVSLAVMLFVGLAIGALPWVRAEATTIGATATVVLATGFTQDHVLLGRLLDTSVGIVVGLLVNVTVWPPLRDLSAARALDAIDTEVGVLLRDIALDVRDPCEESRVDEWIGRTTELDDRIEEAWGLVRQARESGRFNPRRGAPEVARPGEYGEVLHRLEQAVAEIRSMARTLGHSITDTNEWEPDFRDPWVDLLDEAGDAIAEADPERVADVRRRLAVLATDLSTERLSTLHWPEYGALILNLRNVVAAMDRVAASSPVTPETGPGTRLRG